jgi:hypothetical protein
MLSPPASRMKAVRTHNDAIVVPSSGPVYHGQAGQTRTERVHLVEADGAVRSFEVHRVVNVTTDPELKPRALTGQLHRLADGRELALPFVYHDPAARKFALVIPSSLAHLEMKEWARLMSEVAEDTSAPVPTYVRQGTTVLGLGALELFLESGAEPEDEELMEVQQSAGEAAQARSHDLHVREQTLGEREKMLGEREREIAEQEHSMLRLAEDLTLRERSLQLRVDQLDGERSSLRAREQQLESARTDLQKREHDTHAKQSSSRESQQMAAQPSLRGFQEQLEGLRVELHRGEQQISALRTQLRAREQQLERAQLMLAAREQEAIAAQAELRAREREADVVPEGEWQDISLEGRGVVDEVETVVTQVPQPPPLPAIPTERGQRAISVPPPAAVGRVARSSHAPAARISERPAPLEHVDPVPRSSSRLPAVELPPAQRTSIQPTRSSSASSASTTTQRIASLTPAQPLTAAQPPSAPPLSAPSRPAPISTSSRAPAAGTSQRAAAEGAASQRPVTASTSQQRPAASANVSQRPAAREAGPLKGRSGSQRPSRSPTSRPVDDAQTRVTPPNMPAVVVETNAREPSPSQRARRNEVVSQPVRASAAPLARSPSAPASGISKPSPAATRARSEPPEQVSEPLRGSMSDGLSSADLRRRLDEPATRMTAIRELCRRGHPAAITPIFRVLGALTPEEVATTVVCMLALGAGVAGGLVEALDSPSQDVRHAAALGLGQLKLPETLVPLLRRIEIETTPSWTEMARALGDYGLVALAIVVGALPSSDRRERLMVGLAHLANHGCSEELKSLENDPDSSIAMACRQAMARSARIRIEDIAVRTQQPLRDNSPEARFSQVFFATLAAAG